MQYFLSYITKCAKTRNCNVASLNLSQVKSNNTNPNFEY